MTIHPAILGGLLGTALLLATPPAARAEVRTGAAAVASSIDPGPDSRALPATEDEALEYERREAASPEALEFEGGHVVIVSIGFFGLLLIVLIVILLSRD